MALGRMEMVLKGAAIAEANALRVAAEERAAALAAEAARAETVDLTEAMQQQARVAAGAGAEAVANA